MTLLIATTIITHSKELYLQVSNDQRPYTGKDCKCMIEHEQHNQHQSYRHHFIQYIIISRYILHNLVSAQFRA